MLRPRLSGHVIQLSVPNIGLELAIPSFPVQLEEPVTQLSELLA